jgi:hypothetical protein
MITHWNRVLLEKLIIIQVVKKFPAFYETPRLTKSFNFLYPEPVELIPHLPACEKY